MDQAVQIETSDAAPDHPPAVDAGSLFIMAVSAREQGQTETALSLLRRALALDPAHRPSSYLIGHLLVRQEQHEAALGHLRMACAGQPHFEPARHELAEVLIRLKRLPEALAFCEQTVALAPSAQAHFQLGTVFAKLKRFDAAIQSYDRALAMDPANIQSHYNRAHALAGQWKLRSSADELLLGALAGFRHVIELDPGLADAHQNEGYVLGKLGRPKEAIDSFERCLALDRTHTKAHFGLACSLLASGDWERGWAEYEYRFAGMRDDDDDAPAALGGEPTERHLLPQSQGLPGWRGEPLAGKSILLLAEGGYGDVIQFYRFVPVVAQMAASVRTVLPTALQSLLAPDEIRPDVDAPYDFRCSLLSLPLVLKAGPHDLPGVRGYLRADPARLARWRDRLGPRVRPRIGVVWSGSPTHTNDMHRSMRLTDLKPLFDADADFVCLQQFVREADRETMQACPALTFLGDQLKDFSDTAALCELMDVVVSVDTSVAHLAGALGKPVWIMLPRAAEWRWMIERDDSPWYDSARLFRQQRQGEWRHVVDQIRQVLQLRCADDDTGDHGAR